MALMELEGELDWTRCVTPEEYEGKKSWSTTLTLTDDGVKTMMQLKAKGVKNNLKMKDDGRWYVKISRRDGIYKGDKLIKLLSPPIVTDAAGNVIDADTIGNGSKGVVTFDAYEHPVKGGNKATALRLERIKITELVPRPT